MRLRDLTGDTFGRWRVLRRAPNRGKSVMWHCVCDPELGGCGARKQCFGHQLKAGRTNSCGCLRAEIGREKLSRAMKPRWAVIKEAVLHIPGAWEMITALLGKSKRPKKYPR